MLQHFMVAANTQQLHVACMYSCVKSTALALVWLCMHSLSKYINSSLPQLSGMWEAAKCSVTLNTTTLRPLPDELFFCGGQF